MKIRRFVYLGLAILLLGTLSLESVSSQSFPAKELWVKELVDWFPGAEVGSYVAIAHHPNSGRIYISYYDAAETALKMAHEVTAGTGNCGKYDEWQCETVDNDGDVGKYSSIDVVYVKKTLPAISFTKVGIAYYDSTSGALKYAELSTSPFSSSWTIQEVDDLAIMLAPSYGTYTSIKFGLENKPVIAYHYQRVLPSEAGGVRLASYTGSGGSGCGGADADEWNCELVDSGSETGYGTHISLDFNHEMVMGIAFYNSVGNDLRFARYWGFGGSCANTAWNCVVVDNGGIFGSVGEFVSYHAPDSAGEPSQFVYYDRGHQKIKYAYSGTQSGTCAAGYACYAVDTVGEITGHLGLSLTADTEGLPIIAYMDASDEMGHATLNVARPAPAYGLTIGNCGDAPPGFLFMYWTCKVVDIASGYTEEAAYAAVTVRPNGLGVIAYSEWNDHDSEQYLKIAQQRFTTFAPIIIK